MIFYYVNVNDAKLGSTAGKIERERERERERKERKKERKTPLTIINPYQNVRRVD